MSELCLTSLTLESPPPKRTIAVRVRRGKSPGLFWLGGFRSDMKGTKAEALDAWAASEGRACLRFDYSGHGESGGDFLDGSIGRWLEESVGVYREFAKGSQVVIGSSMGGWLALLPRQGRAAEQHRNQQSQQHELAWRHGCLGGACIADGLRIHVILPAPRHGAGAHRAKYSDCFPGSDSAAASCRRLDADHQWRRSLRAGSAP